MDDFVVEHYVESRTVAVINFHGTLTDQACVVIVDRLSFVAALFGDGARCQLDLNTAANAAQLDGHAILKLCAEEAARHGILLHIMWRQPTSGENTTATS